jgi:5-(carboxyamino)imidazole ribonucleotide synthase
MEKEIRQLNIGLLGGGQLGRMLLQESVNWDLRIAILDPAEDAPCRDMTHEFAHGNYRDYDTVYNFGRGRDLITIEFEDVNAEALADLEKEGVKVYPQPHILKIIQDKGLQKQFYRDHQIPTADFTVVKNRSELAGQQRIAYPCFQKLRTSGYDGYGVKKLNSAADIEHAFDEPSVIEALADMDKELSVIVARNAKGEIVHFPVVELVFNPEANMVQYLFAPAAVSPEVEKEAIEIAYKVIDELQMVGLLAVELFLTKDGKVLVNEIAPRPHNSGHHTIEANIVSQYEQHLRAILNLPPGNTATLLPAVMVNILGAKGHTGTPVYEGLETVLRLPGVYVHLYGKTKTKPFRKMGHATVIHTDVEKAKQTAEVILATLHVTAKNDHKEH